VNCPEKTFSKISSNPKERGKPVSNLSKSLKLFTKGWLPLFVLSILVLTTFASSFLTGVSKAQAAADWYNNSWKYRKEITIDHTQVSNTDQLNFPVLINLTDPDLQAHARSDGNDILFADSTGTNKIPYEREQYTGSSGALVAWVKVTTLSHSADTVLYLYYGNLGASDQQDFGATWNTNFKGVWHLNDPANPIDSTSNKNDGTNNNVTATAGKIGEAASFDGADSYIGVTPPGTLAGTFTVSAWAKVSDDQNTHTVIGTRNPNDSSFDFKFDTSGDNIHGDIGDGNDWLNTSADVDPGVFSYSPDTWYEITYAVTPTGYTIYVNGNDVADGTYCYDDNSDPLVCNQTPLLFDPTHNFYIGQVGYDDEWFSGAIEEVRVSDIARSADWVKTEYNNQNSPETFYSLGSETTHDTTPPTLSFTDNVAAGPVISDTVTADWGDATVKKWDYSTDGNCSTVAGDYTKTDVDTLNQTTETNDNKYICLYGEDSAGNISTLVSTHKINIDLTNPIITLLGDTTVNLTVGTSYVDAGATANDHIDGDLTDSMVVSGLLVDTSIPGTFTIHYNVTDKAGNHAAEVTRTVIVSEVVPAVTVLSPVHHHKKKKAKKKILSVIPIVSNNNSPTASVVTNISPGVTMPTENTSSTSLQPPAPVKAPALFDVASTPVSAPHKKTNTVFSLILSILASILIISLVILVIRRIRARVMAKKIKSEMGIAEAEEDG
jgi:hypothetical protein